MRNNIDFIAFLKYNSFDEGGKSTPTKLGYRPQLCFDFEKNSTSGRQIFINKEWVDLKNKYDNKCASCGAKDNQNHPQHPTRITKLERGHCVPGMDMSLGNIIPQCQFCNRAVIDKFIFSKGGSILTINKPELILKSPESVQKSVFELLKKKFEKDLILQQDSI